MMNHATQPIAARLIISGKEVAGDGVVAFSQDPVEGDLLWRGGCAAERQVDGAFVAARQATKRWGSCSVGSRIAVVRQYAKLLQERREALARLISAEMGKPYWESLTEVSTAIAKIEVSIAAIEERRWTQVQQIDGQVACTRYKPLGVMLVIGPYNFPLHLPGSHMVPALLAGNTLVFKPSEQTPAVGQYLAHLWQLAGVPDGVVNLIHGRGDIAANAVRHPELDGVLFTGSYRTGVAIHRALAGKPEKMIALEMGGINSLVVQPMERSTIGAVVYSIINSAFITSGQRCSCARRLILPADAFGDEVLSQLIEATSHITVGRPLAESQSFMGSVVHREAAKQLLALQKTWVEAGAKLLVESKAHDLYPTILSPGLAEVDSGLVSDEEWFGPLLRIERANSLEHAVEMANQTQYGLAASLLGGSAEDFDYFVNHIRAGVVNWNRQTTGASGKLPFGGIGKSGNHRASAYFAADYCSYPVASLEENLLSLPKAPSPGLEEVHQKCAKS